MHVFQLKFSLYSRIQDKTFVEYPRDYFTQSLIKHPQCVLIEADETQFKHRQFVSLLKHHKGNWGHRNYGTSFEVPNFTVHRNLFMYSKL